ncbi:MAG: enoyl-CoA hydratase-related protein [Bacteroidota bacterium]
MSEQSTILLEKLNRVAYLSLNKPPANGYEVNFLEQLLETLHTVEKDPTLKVIILKSRLEKFFCGGADIKVFVNNTVQENKAMVTIARKVSSAISNSQKIFIAAIQGHALGGGLELAMACDLRLAAQGNYHLGLPEIKLGLIPGNGGTARLIHLIGAGRAMELLLTGHSIQAEQAYDYGLVNRIFSKNTFDKEVRDFAERLAQGPIHAMMQIKRFCNQSHGMSIPESLDLEARLVDELYDTPDAREGFQAFVEKRLPNFE